MLPTKFEILGSAVTKYCSSRMLLSLLAAFFYFNAQISSVNGLRNRLTEFDPRFRVLLEIPIAVDSKKRLTGITPTPAMKAHKKKSSTAGSAGKNICSTILTRKYIFYLEYKR